MVERTDVHILPTDDTKPHIESVVCACRPRVEGNMVSHNAWDGREFLEAEAALCAECKTNPVEIVERGGRRRESLWCVPCKARLIEATRGMALTQSEGE